MTDNHTDPEREAWELLNAQYADGWTTRYGRISGDGAVRAITTALRQRDEARAVALEEAARVAETSTCNPDVHSDEFNGTYRVATERIAAAIRALIGTPAEQGDEG